MIIPRHYENLKVLHENTMPNRNYYIPASKKMHALVQASSHTFYESWKMKNEKPNNANVYHGE